MRVPQVSDRIKEAPAVALRGFLAGVGQLLLVTDRLRNKTAADEDVPQARTPDVTENVPEPAQTTTAPSEAPPAPEASASAEAPAKPRDFDKTGNVRLLTEEDSAEASEAAEVEVTVEVSEIVTPVAEAPADAPAVTEAKAPVAKAPAAEEPAAALPLANYDELSVPSLRARLRNLTAAQVAALADYEKTHAARPEVITMYERRIAKLESGR